MKAPRSTIDDFVWDDYVGLTLLPFVAALSQPSVGLSDFSTVRRDHKLEPELERDQN